MTTIKLPRFLRAAALLALLAGRTPPARADDPAPVAPPDASSAGPIDPADLNGDGTVTNRERRRYNRRLRRKQGGANASDPAAPDDAQAAADAASAQSHSAAAGKSAAAAAAAMKDGLPSADAGAGLKPGGPSGLGELGSSGKAASGSGAAAGPGSFAASKASGNPANPQTPGDFVLAARSGYAPAFTAAGLKLGPDGRSIVRADGSPATAADYARLRSGILGMPSALTRRPDFFSAVSPAHFDALKRGFHENPDLADSVYKHVGTTDADRDFVHTASCAKMSGECNENVDKASYKKGEFVAPEDLDRMWGSLQKELDDTGKSDDAAAAKSGGLDAPKIARDAGIEASDDKSPGGTSVRETGEGLKGATASAAATPAAAAAQTASRLWHSAATAMGFGGGTAGGPASRPLGFGALGAAALAALVFALRKRG